MEYDIRKDQKRLGLFTRSGLWGRIRTTGITYKEWLMEIAGLLGILGYFSIEDIRQRSIRIVPLLLAAIMGLVFHLFFGRISIWNLLGGLGIGAVMYMISVISNERVGKGDAMLLAVTGIYLGFWDNLLLLWMASLLTMAVGLVAVVFFRKGKHYELINIYKLN